MVGQRPSSWAVDEVEDSASSAVRVALKELRRGRPVVVIDDEDRENEGDLVLAAAHATPETIAFMIRYSSGLLCTAMTGELTDELRLPLMVPEGNDPRGTAFTVSVDLKTGTSTGVSAADRALTIRALADGATRPEDLSRPGHIFPLRARPGGVLQRAGHTESTIDLARLANLPQAGVLAEITNDDGTMARTPQLHRFAREHGLAVVTVADIVRHRRSTESLVVREAAGRAPADNGEFTAIAYRSTLDGTEHVALVLGDVDQDDTPDKHEESVLVRVHSECLTGDVFGSRRCDCGEQLATAMRRICEVGRGVIVYLRGQEGRGIGLSHKLRAYSLQDTGLDTVDANLAQGLPVDSREYGVGAQILRDLGVRSIRLMTNNPAKYRDLAGYGLDLVRREPIIVNSNVDNVEYLRTKRWRMGHVLDQTGNEVS